MALITKYDTPASLRDVPEGSSFYDKWHNFVNGAGGVSAAPPVPPWIDPVRVDPDVVTVAHPVVDRLPTQDAHRRPARRPRAGLRRR